MENRSELGKTTCLAKNLWLIQGEMPLDSTKAPDPCNVIVYCKDDRLYIIDTSVGTIMRKSIIDLIHQIGSVESFTLINTHNHLDHICNNDIINIVDAKNKHHYILQCGILESTLNAPEYFAEQFNKMDEYYDPFSGYPVYKFKYKLAGFIRDFFGLIVGRKQVLVFLFKMLFKKFKPVNDSRSTMEPFEKTPMQFLNIGNSNWNGWSLGENDIYILEGRAHTYDEVFVYIPEYRLLHLGDLTFPLFPTWDNSDKEKILECLGKSLSMVKSGVVDILTDGHSHQYFTTKQDIEVFLTTIITDHIKYEEIIDDIFKEGEKKTPSEVYNAFKKYDSPVVRKYLEFEFPHTPASLQNVMVTTMLQKGYGFIGKRRHKYFFRKDKFENN
jgi:glyoxylase-like metal-dependent hydrolase (beta-lactamase superfamily II)